MDLFYTALAWILCASTAISLLILAVAVWIDWLDGISNDHSEDER